MLCKTDLHFLNTRHREEMYVCIHFLHEIPWKFTPSEFIAIFFFFMREHASGLQTTGVKLRLTYLFNQYSIRARRVRQLVGDVLRWDECSINWDSCKTLPESAILSQWSAQSVLF